MNVEKFSDELRLGVKGLPNLVIAGSLRNGLRSRLICFDMRVEHCLGSGPNPVTKPRQTPNIIS